MGNLLTKMHILTGRSIKTASLFVQETSCMGNIPFLQVTLDSFLVQDYLRVSVPNRKSTESRILDLRGKFDITGAVRTKLPQKHKFLSLMHTKSSRCFANENISTGLDSVELANEIRFFKSSTISETQPDSKSKVSDVFSQNIKGHCRLKKLCTTQIYYSKTTAVR